MFFEKIRFRGGLNIRIACNKKIIFTTSSIEIFFTTSSIENLFHHFLQRNLFLPLPPEKVFFTTFSIGITILPTYYVGESSLLLPPQQIIFTTSSIGNFFTTSSIENSFHHFLHRKLYFTTSPTKTSEQLLPPQKFQIYPHLLCSFAENSVVFQVKLYAPKLVLQFLGYSRSIPYSKIFNILDVLLFFLNIRIPKNFIFFLQPIFFGIFIIHIPKFVLTFNSSSIFEHSWNFHKPQYFSC